MSLPFTIDDFLGVFETYNQAIWPMQIFAYLFGVVMVLLAIRHSRPGNRLIVVLLSLFWIWVGVVYHIMYFRVINPAAAVFGAFFILQGLLFLVIGLRRDNLTFGTQANFTGIVGTIFILYAMVIYPALGYAFGHIYPKNPMFGVTPCPLLIFTFGLLLWTRSRVSPVLLIIPALWAAIGISAAVQLSIREDFALPITALVTIILLIVQNRRMRSVDTSSASTHTQETIQR